MTINQSPISQNEHAMLERLAGSAEGFRSLLDVTLERGYLEALSDVSTFQRPNAASQTMSWVRLTRLPVHPARTEEYDLLSRWQNVLGTLHAWGHRLVFLLLRHEGETRLYLGAASQSGLMSQRAATAQLHQAARSQMPGIELGAVGEREAVEQIALPLVDLPATGAVTGLPSPREARGSGLLQTLDQIAFGIRDGSDGESDYALVVVADPVPDGRIAAAIHEFRALGSELHGSVKRTVSEGETESSTRSRMFSPGFAIGTLLNFVPVAGPLLAGAGGAFAGLGFTRSQMEGTSRTVGSEQLDKLAQYCERVTDQHVKRLQQGRNLGFWNAGVYVLAESETTVHTLTGMLRSIYSGDESYLEPIRVHLFGSASGAANWIKRFRQIPLLPSTTEGSPDRGDQDHPLSSMFDRVATSLNTEELSLVTSLPRRDVPGLRFVRNAVRFANNPPQLEAGADPVDLGHVLDTGVSLNRRYEFDLNALVRHALVTGVTGSGKSTTCRRLIGEATSRGVPALVIEPAKDEYLRWALERNKDLPEERRIRVYAPGGASSRRYYDGEVLPLRLNPFQPAQVGETVDVASRQERFSAVLTASLPMADVLPLLLEEAIDKFVFGHISGGYDPSDVPAPEAYPKLEGIKPIAAGIISGRGYEQRIQDNLTAAVKTRVDALCRGKRGQVLNVESSTDYSELFERPAVVNLSGITDDRDKALIMALLIIALHEYRVSKYDEDPAYRERAEGNRLCHLAVIEEAHRLLANPQTDYAGIGNPQAVVSGMFTEMLSEIRAYGQGLLIVDQVPARLIPDAVKNTNLKIVHRLVARDDRAAMAASMGLRPEQEDIIAALRQGEAVVCGDLDDAASWVKVEKAARPPAERRAEHA